MGARIKINNVWKEVTDAYTKVNGTWKPVDEGYVKVDGDYKYVYPDVFHFTKYVDSSYSSKWNVLFANGLFYSISKGKTYTSTNGINWNETTNNLSDTGTGTYGFYYNNGIFVCFGSAFSVWVSNDAITWTSRTIQNYSETHPININCMTYGNEKFVALCTTSYEFGVVTSTDGSTWTWTDLSTTEGDKNRKFFSIVFGNNLFVAISCSYGSSTLVQGDSYFRYSYDGTTWFEQRMPNSNGFYYTDLCWTGDKFIAIGGPGATSTNRYIRIATSTNGTVWNSTELSQTAQASEIVSINGVTAFIARDYSIEVSGKIIYGFSIDGINWKLKVIDGYLNRIRRGDTVQFEYKIMCAGDDRVIAVGINNTSSSDGTVILRSNKIRPQS